MADAPIVVTKPVLGTPEYDAAMIAKFDAAQPAANPAQEVAATKPADVPEKFWDAAAGVVNYKAWNDSTTEAQRKITELSTPKPAATPATPVVDPKVALEAKVTALKADPATDPVVLAAAEKAVADYTPAPAAEVLASKGLSMDEFSTEFAEKGELSPESFAKLEAGGIPRAMVDAYIAGQQAIADQHQAECVSVIGGKDNFAKMSAWAAVNASPAEIAAFNAATSGSVAAAQLAIVGMNQRYVAANGQAPALIGGGGPVDGAGGYRSTAEMTTAIKDPRYQKDTAYRADVERKIGLMK